ncbi:MAG: MarR family transcriptional regulator [Clostridia bacterium]|nr:MarR family transcriptional regulator [Clostridia bacterium]
MLMSSLSIIVRGSQVYATRKLSEYGITAAEQYILMYLMGNRDANQDAIAKFFRLDKGSIARSLQKLESKGFIQRKVNDENQREKVITLTEKALNIRDVLNDLLVDWRKEIYNGLSDDEILAFEKTVEKVAENITKIL